MEEKQMIFALRQQDGSLSLLVHENKKPINLPEGSSMEFKEIANSRVKVSSLRGNLEFEIRTPDSPGKLRLSINPDEPIAAPYLNEPIQSIEDLVYSLRVKMNEGW